MQALTIFEAEEATSVLTFLLWLTLKLREQGLTSMHQAVLLVIQKAHDIFLVSGCSGVCSQHLVTAAQKLIW